MSRGPPALDATAAYALAITLLCMPPFIALRGVCKLSVLFVLLLLGAAHQSLVLPREEMRAEYWAHVFPGAILARVAVHHVLAGDGGAIVIPRSSAALASLLFGALIVGEVFTTGMTRLFHLSHVMIFVASCAIAAGAATQAVLLQRCSARAGAIARARVLLDAACLAAIGIILRGHQHDPQPLAVAMHGVQANLLLALASLQLGGWDVHESAG